MNKRTRIGVLVAVLVAFGAGWLGAEVRNADKMPVEEVVAQRWMRGINLLASNPIAGDLMDSKKVPLMVGLNLDGDSAVLPYLYDRLPQSRKDQLIRVIPAARSIATAQGGEDFVRDRQHLLTLVDCMQSVQAHGGSLLECTEKARQSAAIDGGNGAPDGDGSRDTGTVHGI